MNFIEYLEKKQFAPSTISSYLRGVEVLNTWIQKEQIQIKDMKYADILEYIKQLQQENKNKRAIQRNLTACRNYFNYLVKQKVVKDNIFASVYIQGISRRIPHDLLTEQDLLTIYNNYPNNTHLHKRNKVILSLFIYQGIVPNELYKLEIEHINLTEGNIYIPGSRKTNSRTISLHANQILLLHEFINEVRPKALDFFNKETKKLIFNYNPSEFTHNITSVFYKSVKKYTGYATSANQIRYSVITIWLKKYNLREVQYMIGHRYVSSTERYQLTNLEDLQKELMEFFPH